MQTHFEITAYELYSGVQEKIKEEIRTLLTGLGKPRLAGPVTTMVLELAANALKALYKYVFFEYAIKESGLADLPYDDWHNILKEELDTNKARNFEKICREKSLRLTLRCQTRDDKLRFEVENDGSPSAKERKALRAMLKEASHAQNLQAYLAMDEGETSEVTVEEKAGFGLSLIFLTLTGLGLDRHNFRIQVNSRSTTAILEIPFSALDDNGSGKIRVLGTGEETGKTILDVIDNLRFGVVVFDERGNILEVSEALLEQLNLPADKSGHFHELLKARFTEDIFSGPYSVPLVNSFENYRLKVPRYGDDKEILFNISGVLNPQTRRVETIWQTINLGKDMGTLSEGSIFENVHIQNIVRPYIPGMILEKAHASLRSGRFVLENEHREATIFFLDLIGFTAISENLPPAKVIDLLNLAMGIAVKSIEGNQGSIDKFIGDGILAIFPGPLPAVVAAFEIQNNFKGLNEYRRVSGSQPIELRIGINTGMVILGSVGTKRRMDFTALGDVVNTASRIEKSSAANSVLVSDTTYSKIKDQVIVSRSFQQKVKGKQNEITLHFLKKVTYEHAGVTRVLEL